MFSYVEMGKVSAVLSKLTNRAGSLWRTWDRDWERAGLKYWNWSSNLKYYNIKKLRESKIEILKLILKLKIFWFRFQQVQILQLSLQSVQMLILILQPLKILKLVLQLKTYLWIPAGGNIKTGPAKNENIEDSISTGGNIEIN